MKLFYNFTDFGKGLIIGFCVGIIIAATILGVVIWSIQRNHKDKELIQYVEKQIEIQELREDYVNRDPHEFIDDIPGVRGAADRASAEFIRKRDEAVQRLRNRHTD
jgi:hypothetical protein